MGDYVLAQAAETGSDGMVQDKGAINGALNKRNTNDAVPRVYIQVASIEEAVKKIESTGGKSLREPMAIPNGRMTTIADSEGNVIGLVDYSK
jgi:predicted enzyme related to lactoylglutathione lyase